MNAQTFARKYLTIYPRYVKEGIRELAGNAIEGYVPECYSIADGIVVINSIPHDNLVELSRKYHSSLVWCFQRRKNLDLRKLQESVVDRIMIDNSLYSTFKQLLETNDYNASQTLREMGFEEEVKKLVVPEAKAFTSQQKLGLSELEAMLKTEDGKEKLLLTLGLDSFANEH